MKLNPFLITSALIASFGILSARDVPETHELKYRAAERFTEFYYLEVRSL